MNPEQRRHARALKYVSAAQGIRQRVGRVTLEEVQVGQLATIGEMKGLWQALLDRGLITEAQRQDYLDRGADELLAQVEAQASRIYIQDGSGHG